MNRTMNSDSEYEYEDESISGGSQCDDMDNESLCSYEYESGYEDGDDEVAPAQEAKNSSSTEEPEGLPRPLDRAKCETEDSLEQLGRRRANVACDLSAAERAMRRMVRETASLLCVPPGAAHVVLRHFKWDAAVLNDRYFGREESVWRECGVASQCGVHRAARPPPKRTRCGRLPCGICFEESTGPEPERTFAMPCGHEYCVDCWGTYLGTAVGTEGPRCLFATCPEPRCREVVTEDVVAKLAPSALDKFARYQLRSFVETNERMRWCPGPSCERIVATAAADGFEGETTCRCGTTFCLVCGESSHSPLSCRRLADWGRKCVDESENANWILVHTKQCPKCNVRIEKNQGCNHMTCRRCNYEFCWLCMADWKGGHGYNSSCNRFDLKKVEEGTSEVSRAQAELERYLHCYNRFHAHSVGQTFSEDQLRAFLKRKEEEDADAVETPVDRAFKNALRQLIECRRVLKYSYAVSYFMADGSSAKDLFEDQQKLLESFTERLSELTESKERQEKELMNLTGAVAHFVKNVLSGGPY